MNIPVAHHVMPLSILTLLLFVSFAVQVAALEAGGISSTEFNRKLNETTRGPDGPMKRAEMINAAMLGRQLDLIQVCFANPLTVQETLKAVIEVNDKEFKQRVVVMMLRTPSNFVWPTEDPAVVSNGIEPEVMIEPFISVIPQLLPDVRLNENWLKYRSGREELAKQMEAALSAGKKTPGG